MLYCFEAAATKHCLYKPFSENGEKKVVASNSFCMENGKHNVEKPQQRYKFPFRSLPVMASIHLLTGHCATAVTLTATFSTVRKRS